MFGFALVLLLAVPVTAQAPPPTSWLWTFGDGETSTEQHPTHTYEEPGLYTVSLVATNEAGSDTVTKINYIRVFTPLDPVWMTNHQQVPLTISPVDALGDPAPIDGIPTWTTSDSAIVALEPDSSGMAAYAIAVGPLGVSSILVEADRNMGTEVSIITAGVDIRVIALPAMDLQLEAGEPEAQ